jgi:hypothetical protein
MSIRGLIFQWATTQRVGLEQSRTHHHLIENKVVLICWVGVKQQSLTRPLLYHRQDLNNTTWVTRRVSLVEQALLTLPEHLSSHPFFSGFGVIRSLVLYVCFVDRCLSFCTFSFGHCVVCSSIYGFWLPLWYLQTLLIRNRNAYSSRKYRFILGLLAGSSCPSCSHLASVFGLSILTFFKLFVSFH